MGKALSGELHIQGQVLLELLQYCSLKYNLPSLLIQPQVRNYNYCSIIFSYLWDRVCSIFSGAGKFFLAHGLRQITRETKYDVNCLQTLLTCHKRRPPNDVRC